MKNMFKFWGKYLYKTEGIIEEIEMFSVSYHRYISKLLFLPFILISTIFFFSIIIAFYSGYILLSPIYIIVIFISFLLYILYFSKRFSLFLYAADIILLVVSFTCFYYWGVHHFIGIIFITLCLMLTAAILPFKVAFYISLIILNSLLILGIAQSIGIVHYSIWITNVSYLDPFVVFSVLFLFIIILFLYQKNYLIKIANISKLNNKLVAQNAQLQKKVISQTVRVMQNRLKLDESEHILNESFAKLTRIEKDRFLQMNRLASRAIFIGRKVHDIKYPLMYLGNKYEELSIEEVRNIISQISIELDDITRFSGEPEKSVEISILKAVTDSIEVLSWKSCPSIFYDVEYSFPQPIIYGEYSKFIHIITNVIDNAIDSCSSQSVPFIRIVIRRILKSIEIAVYDSGYAIPINIRQKIFREFFSTKRHGTGLGLYICKKYLNEIWGGKISYCRINGLNKFTISIPLAPPN